MDLIPPKLFDRLKLHEGIWFAESSGKISYPDDGNDACYQVEEHSFWFQHRNKCILALVERHLPKDGVFMDVGGGNGFVAKAVQDAGYSVVLVEPFQAGCVNARKRGVNHVVSGVANTQNFPENSIDAIGIFDVLEHIEDRPAFLAELRRLLKPRGKLFITVPAYDFLWSQEDLLAGHYLRYTRKGLMADLQTARFKSIFSSYFFSWLVLPILFFRALPHALGSKEVGEVQKDHAKGSAAQKALSFEISRIGKHKMVASGSSVIGVFTKEINR